MLPYWYEVKKNNLQTTLLIYANPIVAATKMTGTTSETEAEYWGLTDCRLRV